MRLLLYVIELSNIEYLIPNIHSLNLSISLDWRSKLPEILKHELNNMNNALV